MEYVEDAEVEGNAGSYFLDHFVLHVVQSLVVDTSNEDWREYDDPKDNPVGEEN